MGIVNNIADKEQQSAPKRLRSCIACGQKSTKQRLYRVVRSSSDSAAFDATGRRAGRGAYVCSLECFDNAVKRGKFARSLKCSLDASSYQRIRDEFSAHLAENSQE